MDIEKLKEHAKFGILLFLNRGYYLIRRSCRMQAKRPKEPEAICHICAKRGGYFRCRRSKKIDPTRSAV